MLVLALPVLFGVLVVNGPRSLVLYSSSYYEWQAMGWIVLYISAFVGLVIVGRGVWYGVILPRSENRTLMLDGCKSKREAKAWAERERAELYRFIREEAEKKALRENAERDNQGNTGSQK